MSAATGLQGDAKLRTPMSWTRDRDNAGFSTGKPYRVVAANVAKLNVADEQAAPDSLLAYYKSLLALRNGFPSIAAGSYEKPYVDGLVLAYQRRLGGQLALVVINYGGKSATVTIPELGAGAAFKQVFPKSRAEVVVDARGSAKLGIPAQSVRVFVR